MNPITLRQSIIAGVLGGLLFAAFSFGTYYTGIKSFASFNLIYTWLPIMIVILLIFGFNLRKNLGGYINFKEALQFALVAYLVYEIINAIVTYLLFVVIDPLLTKKLFDTIMQTTVSFMKRMGASQSEIDKALENSKKQQVDTGNKNVFLGLGTSLIWDFVKSLLLALVIKKERPADFDFPPQSAA